MSLIMKEMEYLSLQGERTMSIATQHSEQLSVTTTAKTLTASVYDLVNNNEGDRLGGALISIKDTAVRYKHNQVPTVAAGVILAAGSVIKLTSAEEVRGAQFIVDSAGTAVLDVVYYKTAG